MREYDSFTKNNIDALSGEMKKVDLVAFDFDGVLLLGDKDELYARLAEISSRMGLGFTSEQIQEFGKRDDFREIRQLMIEAYNHNYPENRTTENLFQEVNNQVSGMFDNRFRLVEHTIETLKELKATGKKIALVTSRGRNSLMRLLANYNIASYFDVIIDRESCNERKPDPQPLRLALARSGIVDSSRAIYIGDQETDVVAGNAAGMKTLLIGPVFINQEGTQPAHRLESLEPLIQCLS